MLYQVLDKRGRPYSTLDCDPSSCDANLRALPESGAPYSAHAMLTGQQKITHRYRSIAVRHPHGSGIVFGAIGAAPVYFGIFELCKHWFS